MEPHVFCGPEFVLLVPNDRAAEVAQREEPALPVAPAALLAFQRALHALCSPTTRRCLARLPQGCAPSYFTAAPANAPVPLFQSCYHSGSLATGGRVPEAPAALTWVELRPAAALTAEEKQSIPLSVQTVFAAPGLAAEVAAQQQAHLLYLTDSRVAAQIHLLALRSGTIALPHGCQLLPYVRATARGQRLTLAAIGNMRETVRAHANLSGDLWDDMQAALQARQLPDAVLKAYDARDGAAPAPRLRTAEEEHQRCVRALLHYAEREVHYAGVLNNEGAPSPFLLALGLCLSYALTPVDLLQHFVRHPRRLCRALALFYVRYLLPPEELAPFFVPSVGDQVIITTTEDLEVTLSMAALCRALLQQDEVGEAWLPVYHPYWRQRVVEPLLAAMADYWEKGAAAQAEAQATAAPTAPPPPSPPPTREARKGSAKGIAAQYGFHSLQALDAHARAHREVTLVPQSMSVMLARRQHRTPEGAQRAQLLGTAGRAGSASGDSAGGDSDNDDFLIDVEVADGGGGDDDAGRVAGPPPAAAKRSRPGGLTPAPAGPASVAAAEGGVALCGCTRRYGRGVPVVMELLGRHRPFDAQDECYLDF
ncbi:hypothetical protein STCU_07826 [Strigomonas culicis]|uniref:Pre-mRNA-splicing factor 38 n=1 Tax=Strigomonas culicis TaxID=28005 RepID=S9V891_9TRYP|nr:hypothetical protein STCU_07826 [Strigomonas culicis]|eukprot:EPY23186.1 hypothetical protein STCU_07826 [Strigomonas culicis]